MNRLVKCFLLVFDFCTGGSFAGQLSAFFCEAAPVHQVELRGGRKKVELMKAEFSKSVFFNSG